MNIEDEPLVRVFVAVEVSDNVRLTLARVVEKARLSRVRVGWVRPENWHLTLAFLGLVPAEDLPALRAGLDAVADAFMPFRFETAGIGWFGGRRPKVIWAGVPAGSGREILERLAEEVRRAVRQAGHPADERDGFVAHVTLGRLRPGADAGPLLPVLGRHEKEPFGLTEATGIRLMRSRLAPGGSEYALVHESPFRRTS